MIGLEGCGVGSGGLDGVVQKNIEMGKTHKKGCEAFEEDFFENWRERCRVKRREKFAGGKTVKVVTMTFGGLI